MPYDILATSRRQRRKKSFLRVFVVFLFVFFIFLGAAVGIFACDKLKIKSVEVRGIFVLSEDKIQNEIKNVMSAKILGIIPKDRIFSFSIKDIRESLFRQFNRLGDIEIQRDFPDKILIDVKERKPVAILCNEECFFIDKTGFVFEGAPLFSSGVFVKFFDERGLKPGQGEFLLEGEVFKKLLDFKTRLEPISRVVEIHLKDEDVCEFYMQDNWQLILGVKDGLDLIYSNFVVFFKEIMNEYNTEDIEYIDLRFGNKVFYKFDI